MVSFREWHVEMLYNLSNIVRHVGLPTVLKSMPVVVMGPLMFGMFASWAHILEKCHVFFVLSEIRWDLAKYRVWPHSQMESILFGIKSL
jgi:hypothetical protein